MLKPLLEALGIDASASLPRPVPAIDCPTVPLAVATMLGSDAIALASLGLVRRELELGQVVPLVHANWMRSNWACMKLRRRSPSLAATTFLDTVRAARAECVAEEAALEKRWRARLPRLAPPINEAATGKRRKPSK